MGIFVLAWIYHTLTSKGHIRLQFGGNSLCRRFVCRADRLARVIVPLNDPETPAFYFENRCRSSPPFPLATRHFQVHELERPIQTVHGQSPLVSHEFGHARGVEVDGFADRITDHSAGVDCPSHLIAHPFYRLVMLDYPIVGNLSIVI